MYKKCPKGELVAMSVYGFELRMSERVVETKKVDYEMMIIDDKGWPQEMEKSVIVRCVF